MNHCMVGSFLKSISSSLNTLFLAMCRIFQGADAVGSSTIAVQLALPTRHSFKLLLLRAGQKHSFEESWSSNSTVGACNRMAQDHF